MFAKSPNYMGAESSVYSLPQKQVFVTGAQKIRKNQYQSFSVLSHFA